MLRYYEEETHGDKQKGILPLDYRRSTDVLYIGRNLVLDGGLIPYIHELVKFSFVW